MFANFSSKMLSLVTMVYRGHLQNFVFTRLFRDLRIQIILFKSHSLDLQERECSARPIQLLISCIADVLLLLIYTFSDGFQDVDFLFTLD